MLILDFFERLMVSLILGALIGIERQLTGHSIEIRTNVLVSVGTTLFTLYPFIVGVQDVFRIAAQIISGVGFLGTGIIFKDGTSVKGINTAATIWCTAAIGILSGAGKFKYAVIATIIIISSNIIFRTVSRKLTNIFLFKESELYYQVSLTCLKKDVLAVKEFIVKETPNDFFLTNLKSKKKNDCESEIEVILICKVGKKDDVLVKFVAKIEEKKQISTIGWKVLEQI